LGGRVPCTLWNLRQVTESSLLIPTGDLRWVFAQDSYREFLAAHFLRMRDLPPQPQRQLLPTTCWWYPKTPATARACAPRALAGVTEPTPDALTQIADLSHDASPEVVAAALRHLYPGHLTVTD